MFFKKTSQNHISDKVYITQEEVRKNIIKSLLLILAMAAFIIAISIAIGYLWGDIYSGLVIGASITVIVIPVQLLTAKITILASTRSKKIDLSNPNYQIVQSIVEGLSIAAGFKNVPKVYIIPTDIPNAFASGFSEKSAYIGVTQGLINRLNKSELEGVIGHEISHIAHKDVLVSQLAVSLVSIIIMLNAILSRALFFSRYSGRSRNSDSRNNNSSNAGAFILIISLLAVILRPIASLIANLIQLSISRKREYAADAYSVRLCGYSEGLASALEKISNKNVYSKEDADSLGGTQMKCLYIYFPFGQSNSSLFSTHPPIEERIKRLRSMY